jgi:hypothetical protein
MFPRFTAFVSNSFVNLVFLLPSFNVFLVVPSKPRAICCYLIMLLGWNSLILFFFVSYLLDVHYYADSTQFAG